ncbi:MULTISPECIES: hypothetical protein [Thalassospira]|uniref:hypothetical protein n=1 Tax=Thalassospira TaxID=168934 RepID=UPI0008DDE1D9|nr:MULTISPECIES: hypothetical protein [Thalassospira]MDM7975418.1 hypothetical protein [Thalassospira xiamenensis]OHZ00815.1 hypothetical protein BC440_08130 [Thalassospira sp. MIT1004]
MDALSREEREELRGNGPCVGSFVVVIQNDPPFASGSSKPEKKRYCVVGGFDSRDDAWNWGNDAINNRRSWAVIEVLSPERGLDLDYLK